MVNSKNKGSRGERELAKTLREYGYDVRRSVQYNGKADGAQADVIGLDYIHAEVKRVERLQIYDAIAQAKRDSKGSSLPTVFHRRNNHEWLVTMPLDSWMLLYKAYREAREEEEEW